MTVGEAVQAVLLALAKGPWRAPTENALQEAVFQALAPLGGNVVRELRLTDRDRVDVAVGYVDWNGPRTADPDDPDAFVMQDLVVVEVKLEAPTSAVVRQLQRYALSPRVGAVVLASTSARLCAAVPRGLGGKPVYPAHLRRF